MDFTFNINILSFYHIFGVLFCTLVQIQSILCYFENGTPMVAFKCGYPAMHMTSQGWVTDNLTDCLETNNDILEYCQNIYPSLQVNNILQKTEDITIDNWCKKGHSHCTHFGSRTARPYKCLAGAFQSEALLVPDHCVFDHLHEDAESKCKDLGEWNYTAIGKCHERNMRIKSFAPLMPCGVGIFGGVEFVCCPPPQIPDVGIQGTRKENNRDEVQELVDEFDNDETERKNMKNNIPEYNEDDETLEEEDEEEDEVEEEEEEEEEFEEEEDDDAYIYDDNSIFASETQKSSDSSPTPSTNNYEAYLRNTQVLGNEHSQFLAAKNELREHHHEKVTKMMKEWQAARGRMEKLKETDAKAADKWNREITVRFQKTYQALEQEGIAEKKQLVAIHQQKIQGTLNERKRKAMDEYMKSLQNPEMEKNQGIEEKDINEIMKTLRRYIKTEKKDCEHTIKHYEHLKNTEPAEADRISRQVVDHLKICEERINQSLAMLNRVPGIKEDILIKINAFLNEYSKLNEDINRIIKEGPKDSQNVVPVEDEPMMVEEQKKLVQDANTHSEENVDPVPATETETVRTETKISATEETVPSSTNDLQQINVQQSVVRNPTDFDEDEREDEHAYIEIKPATKEILKEAPIAHISDNSLTAEESYIRKTHLPSSAWSSINSHYGIAIGCISVFIIIVIGIVVLRKKAQRVPVNHGFVEVDQAASPEERHVANMQINGYENPTYKYFEHNAMA